MNSLMQKATAAASALAIGTSLLATNAFGATPAFTVVPGEFVGTAAQCGGVAGTDTVTAQWVNGAGVDGSTAILLQKLGDTSNCAAAYADVISPLEGGSISALTELNFAYKGACGGGLRFNVQVDGNTYFLGCNFGTQTPLSNGYTLAEFGPADFAAAGIPTTGTLEDLYIIMDQGSDTSTGTAYIDNVSVNGAIVGEPSADQLKNSCKNGGYKSYTGANGSYGPFKNQGDCVSYFATKGKNLPSGTVTVTPTPTVSLTPTPTP